ncbi:MAG: hypothetical protein LBH47_03885 [Christensenellaceae bacterium]|jgi:hypothetical protein|nr:hypothetical protein [Christensenellaceae bacterium]
MKKDDEHGYKCCLCGKKCYGWGDRKQYGNNPSPLADKRENCCDKCNAELVIPARLDENRKFFKEEKGNENAK